MGVMLVMSEMRSQHINQQQRTETWMAVKRLADVRQHHRQQRVAVDMLTHYS